MLVIFEDIFHLWSWQQNRLYVEIFTRRVCADRTRYFEPKREHIFSEHSSYGFVPKPHQNKSIVKKYN